MFQYPNSVAVQVSLELFHISKNRQKIPTHTLLHTYLKIKNESVTFLMQKKISSYLKIKHFS